MVYGNKNILSAFTAMLEKSRLPHSILLYGENGLGKKTLSRHMAKMMLCENGMPCETCRSCKNVENGNHPDVIWVEHSGKLGGFSAETIRNICSEAYIKPTSANRKIYILADADSITVPAQNSLLKLIEEPPDFTYFIFTAKDKNAFLPTVISRLISMGMSECDECETISALRNMGYSDEMINDAVTAFCGNIGKCRDFIENPKYADIVKLIKQITDSIIERNEYALAVNLSVLENDRNAVIELLSLLDKEMRDTLALRYNPEVTIGSYKNGALKLSNTLTVNGTVKIHEFIALALSQINSNVSLKLVLTRLCGAIMSVL